MNYAFADACILFAWHSCVYDFTSNSYEFLIKVRLNVNVMATMWVLPFWDAHHVYSTYIENHFMFYTMWRMLEIYFGWWKLKNYYSIRIWNKIYHMKHRLQGSESLSLYQCSSHTSSRRFNFEGTFLHRERAFIICDVISHEMCVYKYIHIAMMRTLCGIIERK